jgi:hypothetical protein
MQIMSSMIFFLLERKFNVMYPRTELTGAAITEPRLLDSPELVEPGILYITNRPELLNAIEKPAPCAFLLCGTAGNYAVESASAQAALPAWAQAAADIACINDEVSPINLLESVFSLFLALQDWDNRLKDASSDAADDYGRIFKISREFFDLPFLLIDRNFTTVAYTPDVFSSGEQAGRERISLEALNKMLLLGDEYYRVSDLPEPYLYPAGEPGGHPGGHPGGGSLRPLRHLCCNIFRGSHFEGRIVALFELPKNHPGRSHLLKHLCIYIGKVFINTTDDILAKRQNDPLHQLVRDSIFNADGTPERNAIRVLGELAWQINDPYLLVVFQIADERRFSHGGLYVCRHLETDVLHSCAITYASHIIWLINTKDIAQRNIKRDYQQIIAFIVREYNCKAGVSQSFANFIELKNAHVQAAAALRLGDKRDPQLRVYGFTDYVLDYILERTASELPAEYLLHPGAVQLWNLDKHSGTD